MEITVHINLQKVTGEALDKTASSAVGVEVVRKTEGSVESRTHSPMPRPTSKA